MKEHKHLIILHLNNKKLSYRREAARQLRTTF